MIAKPFTRPLGELLRNVAGARLIQGTSDVPVAGVSNDTRTIRPGELFVAVPGFQTDALTLVPRGLAAGAAAVVAEAVPADLPPSVPLVLVPSARAALADLAAGFYGFPSRQLAVVGITGTDGKSTTTHLLSAILEMAGLRTGWLSTVNTRVGDRIEPLPPSHTTPEAPVVQRALADMVAAGVQVAIVETSSHALELDRVRGIDFAAGVFTNLSPEHINFHGSFAAYRAAKARLFERLSADGLAVLNADDPAASYFQSRTPARVITYGLDDAADLNARDVQLLQDGTRFVVRAPEGERAVTTRLLGRFNVANWLAAYGAARAYGATLTHFAEAAERHEAVPGRMQLVREGQPYLVIVDFAHTPQALERALSTARALANGRVLAMFGLAGGRDAGNRPIMGAIAAAQSDFFMVTTDDAYDESPSDIAAAVARGATEQGAISGRDFDVELDRRTALQRVLRMARAGDVVLLAGHGHEQSLNVGSERIPWNDAHAAREELMALGYGG